MLPGNLGSVVWAEGPWHHLVSKGAGHDLEFWKPALCLCLVLGDSLPKVMGVIPPSTLDGPFQLRAGKPGDGMFSLSFTLPLGSSPSQQSGSARRSGTESPTSRDQLQGALCRSNLKTNGNSVVRSVTSVPKEFKSFVDLVYVKN